MAGMHRVCICLSLLAFLCLSLSWTTVKVNAQEKKTRRIFTCKFETEDICGFTQDTTDNFDWTRTSAQTPSGGTGPREDHSPDGEYYMYIEATDARRAQEARLISPSFPVSSLQLYVLRFFYHMKGSTIGHLNIYIRNSEGRNRLLWTEIGHQGDLWYTSNLIFYADEDFQLVLEAIRGNRQKSDIAIDDVFLSKTEYPLTCDLESYCSLLHQRTNTDDFNWKINTGSTATLLTGPNYDHTYLNTTGRYYYLEASARDDGHTAKLFSPHFADTNNDGIAVNFTFYYHMYGSGIGSLNVYFSTVDSEELVWTREGSQGNGWRYAEINTFTTQTHQFVIVGVVNDFRGDIAIDDLCLDEYVPQVMTTNTGNEEMDTTVDTTPGQTKTVPSGEFIKAPYKSSPGVSAATIGGIIIGAVVLIVIAIALGVFLYKSRSKTPSAYLNEDRQVIVEGSTQVGTQQPVNINVYDNVAKFQSDSEQPSTTVTKSTTEPGQDLSFTNPIYENANENTENHSHVTVLRDDSKA